ncbi:MAG: glutathione S-transferase family protein [Pseudomonadota bacterium]
MTQRYTLYGSPDSANLVIRILLHELGESFETIWLNRSKQEHKQAPYLKLNPQGLIPVLIDNGQAIFETAAILLHVCDTHGKLAPQSGSHRARFLQWLFYLSNTPHADLRARFNSNDYVEGQAEQTALRAGMGKRFQSHLTLIETELAANSAGPWFFGESLSALDIYLAALCRWSQLYPVDEPAATIDAKAMPALHHLLNEMAARPSVVAACAEESIIEPFFIGPTLPDLPEDMITG